MKRIKDERIILETNKLVSKLFWLLTALLLLLAVGNFCFWNTPRICCF